MEKKVASSELRKYNKQSEEKEGNTKDVICQTPFGEVK